MFWLTQLAIAINMPGGQILVSAGLLVWGAYLADPESRKMIIGFCLGVLSRSMGEANKQREVPPVAPLPPLAEVHTRIEQETVSHNAINDNPPAVIPS